MLKGGKVKIVVHICAKGLESENGGAYWCWKDGKVKNGGAYWCKWARKRQNCGAYL